LDGVEIPQDPDKRIEFLQKKADRAMEKVLILHDDSPYKKRTLAEAFKFFNV